MFAAIGDNISLGTDPLSVLWSNSNAKVRFDWRKLTESSAAFLLILSVSTHASMTHFWETHVMSFAVVGKMHG